MPGFTRHDSIAKAGASARQKPDHKGGCGWAKNCLAFTRFIGRHFVSPTHWSQAADAGIDFLGQQPPLWSGFRRAPEWPAEVVLEIVERFSAASYEAQKVEGHWRHQGILYPDNLVKIVIDSADNEGNRDWMR